MFTIADVRYIFPSISTRSHLSDRRSIYIYTFSNIPLLLHVSYDEHFLFVVVSTARYLLLSMSKTKILSQKKKEISKGFTSIYNNTADSQ